MQVLHTIVLNMHHRKPLPNGGLPTSCLIERVGRGLEERSVEQACLPAQNPAIGQTRMSGLPLNSILQQPARM